MTGCTFDGNIGNEGAGIFFESTNTDAFFLLSGTNTFKNNNAGISGGAIQFSGKKVTASDVN